MFNNGDSPALTWRPRLGIYTGGQNNKFNPRTFEGTSYNWWVYVKKIKGLVIFNDYNYSSTTNKHQYKMRTFLKEFLGSQYKKMIFVSQRESLNEGIVLDALYRGLFLNEIQVKLNGRSKSYYESRRENIASIKKEIKKLRKIGGKTKSSLKEIKAGVINSEKYRINAQREYNKALKEKRNALIKEHGTEMNSLDAVAI